MNYQINKTICKGIEKNYNDKQLNVQWDKYSNFSVKRFLNTLLTESVTFSKFPHDSMIECVRQRFECNHAGF